MTIRELRGYLEGHPDDGEVWMETGFGLSSPVERIKLLNFRGPKEHDLLIGPREGHEWANGHADSRIWAAWKDDPELAAVARELIDDGVYGCTTMLNEWIRRMKERLSNDDEPSRNDTDHQLSD